MRNAELDFQDGVSIEIESRFEHCNIRLGHDTELVVGEKGILEDCTITGGRLRVLGQFKELRSPGLDGPSEFSVSAKGRVSATLAQAKQGTQFAFERGCRLRLKIVKPGTGNEQEG
jgi:hypothetical protein